MNGTALSDADIMAAYDAEIMRNGSADSVLLRTVKACIAADCRLTAEQPVAWKWTNSETGGSGYLPERKLDFPYAHLYSWQPLYARAPVTAEQGGADDGRQQSLWVHDLGGPTETIHDKREAFGENDEWTEFRRAALTTQPQAEPPSETERLLLNLLAVIHRDGGHYVEAHGLKKATADAQEWVVGQLFTQPQAEPADYRDAYEGAREDLLDWKRRALEAEQTVRQLARALGEEVNGATFMGEPAPTAQPQAEPADARIYWHASLGWQVEWLTAAPNGGASNYYRATTAPTEPTA